MSRSLAVPAALLLVAGCINTGSDRVLGVDAEGVIEATVVFDANGSGRADQGDTPLPGVAVEIRAGGANDVEQRRLSDANGLVRFRAVPVGTYRIVVDDATVDDSLVVGLIDTTLVTLRPLDTAIVTISVGFPRVTIAEARALPVGRKVFVTGIALNARVTFDDSTMHLTDATASIRGIRVRANSMDAGDSVRFLGTTAVRDGQPVLDGVTVFFLDSPGLPDAVVLSSALAASANGSLLDAAQVRVLQVTISDTATVFGERRLTVSDGSGDLIVTIDPALGLDTDPLLPDSTMDVSGVLVPRGAAWTLKPRFAADIRR